MGFKRVQEFISGNGAAQTAHHTSLPSAEEEEALRERGRIASNDVGLASRSLPSLAILRVNRWLVGLFDMFESSLGGSELNSMWWTRRKAGDTKRCGVTCPMSGSSSDGGRSSTSCGEATMMESSIRVHLVSRSNLTTPPQEDWFTHHCQRVEHHGWNGAATTSAQLPRATPVLGSSAASSACRAAGSPPACQGAW